MTTIYLCAHFFLFRFGFAQPFGHNNHCWSFLFFQAVWRFFSFFFRKSVHFLYIGKLCSLPCVCVEKKWYTKTIAVTAREERKKRAATDGIIILRTIFTVHCFRFWRAEEKTSSSLRCCTSHKCGSAMWMFTISTIFVLFARARATYLHYIRKWWDRFTFTVSSFCVLKSVYAKYLVYGARAQTRAG